MSIGKQFDILNSWLDDMIVVKNTHQIKMSATKCIKKREKPNKKWSEGEVAIILNYLQNAIEIEAPTAQIFYKKLIESTGLDVSWELMRWKVRHLKQTYKKASDWKKGTGAGVLENDECGSVEGKVLQICPHYKQLHEIFGGKTSEMPVITVDSGECNALDENTMMGDIGSEIPELSPNLYTNTAEELDVSTSHQSVLSNKPTNQQHFKNDVRQFANKMRKNVPKSSVDHLIAFQEERTAILKLKLDWKRQKFKKEMKFEEEKLKSEQEIRKLEIAKEEKLTILKIEKEERLQTREFLKLNFFSLNRIN